jgi:hypothetical protein
MSTVIFVNVDLDRSLFTNHGLHLKGPGKDAIVKQLVCHIHDRLFKKASTPTGLGWKNDPPNHIL